MTEKFKKKYRIESTRLQNWDYRWAGAYFVTICTKDRQHYFGEIEEGKMILSNLGVLADKFWHEIISHAKNVELGEFVVMPNHIHGILILRNDIVENVDKIDNAENGDNVENANNTEPAPIVEARHALPLRLGPSSPEQWNDKTIGQKRFQNQGKNSISAMVGGYKSAVTKHANQLGLEFAWQPRFYDHIIRDEKSFENISNYIINNPLNWVGDRFGGTE